MYNFTVAEAHTYFVGDARWLVHNACLSASELNKLNHIFGKTEHKLDSLVDAFNGSAEHAFRAMQTEFSSVANNYSRQQLNRGIQITLNGIEVTVRGTIVDGKAQIGTAFIP